MLQEAQTNGLGGAHKLNCCALVSVARRGITRRMVVRDGECPTVVAKHGIQDLSNRKERPIDRALADRDDPQQLVPGIAHEDDHTLSPCAAQLTKRHSGDILRAPQPLATRLGVAHQIAQPERRSEDGGLRRPDPRVAGQLLRKGRSNAGQPAEVRDERVCQLGSTLTLAARAQKDRDKLAFAECPDSQRQQTFARTVVGGDVP